MTTDSLQLFLKDIGKRPLLSAQEEVALAKRIAPGELDAKQEDGRVEPPSRRFDREELPQPVLFIGDELAELRLFAVTDGLLERDRRSRLSLPSTGRSRISARIRCETRWGISGCSPTKP
jgi:hypothetical protein